ncbi:hypothetical protein [Bizionia myxarmorum]|uniref:Gliding motility lipoprotein GldD n=1 Tax=Bizionia myxarmorum TaxID=291186 RepID=A0A5D0R972_9FLAO|nr:hypothetical protein [Bizionia myxarmorum]TYB78200.1 hypothetical protein ES674_00005 [Bizionia myxarmorum]
MTRNLLLILTILTFISCGNKSNETIYKTKSGEYASKTGNFIAAFPFEPNYTAIDNQMGLDKFQIHLYRSALNQNKIFSIEYYDYPEYLSKSMTDEQLYLQGVTNFSNKMAESFKLEFQEAIEQHGLKGQYFVLNLKKNALDKGIKGHIQGKIFRKGNRIYTITYVGQDDKNVDSFMKSFRLIK